MKLLNIAIGVIFLIVYNILEPRAADNLWTTNGPSGGRVFTIAVNPQNSNIIYLGTVEDGIHKTTNAGITWEQITNDTAIKTVRMIAIHPLHPETIYVATEKGIYKSDNSGDSWYLLHPQGSVYSEYRAILIHPLLNNIIIAGGPWVEKRSTDSGETWEDICIDSTYYPVDVGIQAICADVQNPNKLYIATNSTMGGMGAYKSVDLGVHWQNIQNNIDSAGWGWNIAVDPVDTNIIYYARLLEEGQGRGQFLSKSTNGGLSWVDISPSPITKTGVMEVKISPYDHNTVFICTQMDGVLKSINQGESWQSSNVGLTGLQSKTIVFDSLSGAIYLGLYYHGIYKSLDYGQSWFRISQGINNYNSLTISTDINSNSNVYVTGVSELSISRDAGDEWYFPDIGISQYNRARDALIIPNIPGLLLVSTVSTVYQYQYLCGIFRSDNSGISWEYISVDSMQYNNYTLLANSYDNFHNNVLLCSDRGLYYSTNLGFSWNACNGGLPNNINIQKITTAPSNTGKIGIIDDTFLYYESNDCGENWALVSEVPHSYVNLVDGLVFHPQDDHIIWVSVGGIGLVMSSNSGESWQEINSDLPLGQFPEVSKLLINPVNPQNMFITSLDYGVYLSNNGGQNWQSFNEGLDSANSFGIIAFAPNDTTKLYLATLDRSVWSIHRTLEGIDDDTPDIPSVLSLSSYPNPFNAQTTIRYSLPEAGPVTLTIYNLLGQKIATLFDGVQTAGEHSIVWDAKKQPSGVYYTKINTGKHESSWQMILLK